MVNHTLVIDQKNKVMDLLSTYIGQPLSEHYEKEDEVNLLEGQIDSIDQFESMSAVTFSSAGYAKETEFSKNK